MVHMSQTLLYKIMGYENGNLLALKFLLRLLECCLPDGLDCMMCHIQANYIEGALPTSKEGVYSVSFLYCCQGEVLHRG